METTSPSLRLSELTAIYRTPLLGSSFLTWRPVQKHPLRRADADRFEHVRVGHGQDDGLDELLNLQIGSSYVCGACMA